MGSRVRAKDGALRSGPDEVNPVDGDVDEVVADDGVSGVSTTLAERPQGRRLFDLLRRGDVLVVR
jgi:putative DNA-invertase from lambdoid prophage Rac